MRTRKIIDKIISAIMTLTSAFLVCGNLNGLFDYAVYAEEMGISDSGVEFICSMEGFHEYCYYDYAQSSIGFGTKCTGSDIQPHEPGTHRITREVALAAMKEQINDTYAPRVRKQTAGISMTQNQFDALVSLCYNCGGGTSLISNSPLVKYLIGELTEQQAREEYASYIIKVNGQVLEGLINRRKAEAELFFSAEEHRIKDDRYPTPIKAYSLADSGKITVYDMSGEPYP